MSQIETITKKYAEEEGERKKQAKDKTRAKLLSLTRELLGEPIENFYLDESYSSGDHGIRIVWEDRIELFLSPDYSLFGTNENSFLWVRPFFSNEDKELYRFLDRSFAGDGVDYATTPEKFRRALQYALSRREDIIKAHKKWKETPKPTFPENTYYDERIIPKGWLKNLFK